MTTKQYLIPGIGYVNEATNKQYLLPGTVYLNETQTATGGGSFKPCWIPQKKRVIGGGVI
jgi:hypothetical protein